MSFENNQRVFNILAGVQVTRFRFSTADEFPGYLMLKNIQCSPTNT
jgi:hypothetical protein